MRTGGAAATIIAVGEPQDTTSLTLELEPGEPIHGRLRDRAGAVHPFRGWLELSAAVERVWRAAGLGREGEGQVS
jgi:hypothetical protein